MSETSEFRYCAFLSYSHRDTAWARWLHRALERYRVDKELIGRETPIGPVPRTLRPIFRDRDDLAAGKSLSTEIVKKLAGSRFLVVVCSPSSAASLYVDEEIRQFKQMGRADYIIPFIIDGDPVDGRSKCYPPALHDRLSEGGAATSEGDELIGADARPHADGKHPAKLKVIAGLLGLDLDEIVRRDRLQRRRQVRVRCAIAATIVALIAASVSGFVIARHELARNAILLDHTLQRGTSLLNEATGLSERLGAPRFVSLALLTQADRLFGDVADLGRVSPELLHRRAWMNIQFARSYAVLGQIDKRRAKADAAARIMEQLTLANPGNAAWRRDVSVTYNELGDILMDERRFDEALTHYAAARVIRERLVAENRQSGDLRRDLMVSDFKVGDALIEREQLAEASKVYEAGFATAHQLLRDDSESPARRRDMAIAEEKIGRLAFEECELAAALVHYRTSLDIRQSLALAASKSLQSERDLMVVHARIADVLLAQDDVPAARASYQVASEIATRLTSADASNVIWRRDLAILREMIAQVAGGQSTVNAFAGCRYGKRLRGATLSTELVNRAAIFLGTGNDEEALNLLYASAAATQPYGEAQDLVVVRKKVVVLLLAMGALDKAARTITSSGAALAREFGSSDARTIEGNATFRDVLMRYGGNSAERWTSIAQAFRKLGADRGLKGAAATWVALAEQQLAGLQHAS